MTNLPLNITALEEANINVKTNKNEVPTSINLSYSFDNETWYQFDFDAGVDLQTNQKIYLKGNNNR
ncbi:MAG: hypothetical protein MJ201_00980 [Mycoplasmoidaceae bacterium]|nr:hypothetical protein [Mycoplasmoidaceae bacterium]